MATISAISSLSSNFTVHSSNFRSATVFSSSFRVGFGVTRYSFTGLGVAAKKSVRFPFPRLRKLKAVAGGGDGEGNVENLNSQEDGGVVESIGERQEVTEAVASVATTTTTTTIDQTVSVTVSPSDVLTMIFQAEGTMAEADIRKVTEALEKTEGVKDLKVQAREGLASVELTKQTTVQASGAASGLVEIIQGSGFKLQTLNLSFQDDEDRN